VTLHSAAVTASSPEFFVNVLSAVYGPAAEEASEETEDTAAVRVRSVATQAFNALRSWRKVPGLQKNGVVDGQELESWVEEARKRCADPGLAPIGDDHIGKMLAFSPAEADGVWPANAVREIIESVRSWDRILRLSTTPGRPRLLEGVESIQVYTLREPNSCAEVCACIKSSPSFRARRKST
jgi:hypothetical protein